MPQLRNLSGATGENTFDSEGNLANLTKLSKRRDVVFQRMTSLIDRTKVATSVTIIDIYIEAFSKLHTEFEELQLEILSINESIPDARLRIDVKDVEFAVDLLLQAMVDRKEALTPEVSNTSTSSQDSQIPDQTKLLLPKIEMPIFSGDLDKWEEFQSCFESAVHSNKHLSSLSKLHYLRSLLSAEPLSVLASLQFTADNYDEIYLKLKDHYSDSRRLFQHNFAKIFNRKYSDLKRFRLEHLSAVSNIKNSNISDVKDYLLLSISLNNLSHELRKDFEAQLKPDYTPTFDDLIKFVTERIRLSDLSVDTLKTNPPTSPKPKTVSKQASFHVSEHVQRCEPKKTSPQIQPKLRNDSFVNPGHRPFIPRENRWETFNPRTLRCPLCKGPQRIYSCPIYLNFSPQQRQTWAWQHDRCSNCLGLHEDSQCQSSLRCSLCDSRHHTSLHLACVKPRSQGRPDHNGYAKLSRPRSVSPSVDKIRQQNSRSRRSVSPPQRGKTSSSPPNRVKSQVHSASVSQK